MSIYKDHKPPMVEPPPRLPPLAFTGCRWPVERDGGIAFCSAARARDIYCAEHASHAGPEIETRPLMRNQKMGRPRAAPLAHVEAQAADLPIPGRPRPKASMCAVNTSGEK